MRRQWGAILVAGMIVAALALAGLGGSYVVPLDHEAIQYASRPVDDAVSRLEWRTARREAKLDFDERHGYLRSLLRELRVPIESQVLVFSKTSFQARRISPRLPRAIYFNDHVAVGWVRGGDVLEIAAVDPRQGVIFYALDQERSARPRPQRSDTCLQCHATGSTLGVPGLFVRSVFPDPSGMPHFQAGGFVTDHRSPLAERWGGWYVTGTHGSQRHLGNAVAPDSAQPNVLATEATQNVTDLHGRFDVGAYLTPHSDLVALMVLEHQTHMTNLLTRVGFETRLALHGQAVMNKALGRPEEEPSESATRRIHAAVEELLEYLLFIEEFPLPAPVRGTSGFAAAFPREGPRDRQGRSLRDLDLERRLFRHPCSYLLYTEAFDGLPAAAQERLYRRLWEVLTGRDQSPRFARLEPADRKAVLEILRETKTGLPAYWRP